MRYIPYNITWCVQVYMCICVIHQHTNFYCVYLWTWLKFVRLLYYITMKKNTTTTQQIFTHLLAAYYSKAIKHSSKQHLWIGIILNIQKKCSHSMPACQPIHDQFDQDRSYSFDEHKKCLSKKKKRRLTQYGSVGLPLYH